MGILLTVIRLVEQKTDVVIAVNMPHVAGTYDAAGVDLAAGRHGALIGDAMRYRERILETFEVRDWGLFGSDD